MRQFVSRVAAILLLVPGGVFAQSQNCAVSGHRVGLLEGKYDLPLKLSGTATIKDQVWAVEYSGTVHLSVNDEGSTSATGDATLRIHGEASLGDASHGKLRIDTSSTGSLSTYSSSMTNFTMQGELKGAGTGTSILGAVGGHSNGSEELTFEIVGSSCEHAYGNFKSKAFTSVIEGFKAKGYATTSPNFSAWEVGEGSETETEVDKLQAELKPIEAGAGTDAASDAQKLEAVLTRINGKQGTTLKKCLKRVWRESAMNVMAKDLAPKLTKLAAVSETGDVSGLNALFDEALAVDKQYVRLGLDSCTDGQRPQFELLQAKAGAMLVNAIKAGNAQQILEFDKQYQLVGAVEQTGSDRAWAAVMKIVMAEHKAAKADAKKILDPMRKKGGSKSVRCDDAEARRALRVYLAADRQLQILRAGEGPTEAMNDSAFFDGACTK